uniref:Pentatricopeptide repeat-containing protein n=1 Tax=Nymphaea colorata TaxID=210225 RepID=A0A5K1FKY5_9MAGN
MPDDAPYYIWLQWISSAYAHAELHSNGVTWGFRADMFVKAALVAMYSKCSDLVTVRQVFDEMPARNVIAWKPMIASHEQSGLAAMVILIFDNN